MIEPGAIMKATVKKWGNSAAVRIPASVTVIESVRQKKYVVDDLLKGITAKNLHGAIDFGTAQGKEIC